jgi:hypothetical protein
VERVHIADAVVPDKPVGNDERLAFIDGPKAVHGEAIHASAWLLLIVQ